MVAFPIAVEGQTDQQLAASAADFLKQKSGNYDAVKPYVDKYSNLPTSAALKRLGADYLAAQDNQNTELQSTIIQAMGSVKLVGELKHARAAGEYQYRVESWRDLNVAARESALASAKAPTSDTQRAASAVVGNDDYKYRNEVATKVDAFLQSHRGQSANAIRTAMDREIYDNSGVGQSVLEGIGSVLGGGKTTATVKTDMRKTYEAMLTGHAPEVQTAGNILSTPAAAATLPPKAPATPAAGAAPAPATAAPKAPAAPAAGAAPAATAHHSWTPIEKQVQFDLETIGKTTGQHRGWKIEDGVESMDGKNGRHTGESLAKFLKDNNLTELNDAAKAKLHELAENQRRAQAAAKTAGAPAVAAGAGAGQPAGTPSAPAAATPGTPAAAASR